MIFAVIMLMFTNADFVRDVIGLTPSQASSFVERTRSMLLLLGVVFLFIAIVQLFKVLSTAKCFICVCEDRVYGVAGKSLYFSTQPFEVTFDRITNVGKGSAILGNIKIEAGPNIYGSIVSEPEQVIGLIKEKIGRLY